MQGFEFTVQAAFRTFVFFGYTLLALTARKRISQVNAVYHCGCSEQKALPSCGLPKPFTFVLDSVGLGGFVFRPIYMPKAIVRFWAMAFIMLISFIF